MNDGICDPQGRFWAGTMAYAETPGAGRLYRLELDGSCTLVLDGLTISNGMGWSPDGTIMYLADSGVGDVFAFDFDPSGGTLDQRRTFVHVGTPGAAPDGLTVDSDGDVWVALWNGGAVARYAPDGSLRETVPVPVDRPTSCAFGGRDGATLFVTTSREGLDPRRPRPPAARRTRPVHRRPGRHRPALHALPRPRDPIMKLLAVGGRPASLCVTWRSGRGLLPPV
jgi:sugar lactone lactonase YvrE